MSSIENARAALVAWLKTDADTAALVGTRVFGDELPQSETDGMELNGQGRKAVVIAAGGGAPPTFAARTVPLEAQRLDIYCYGETLYEAERVRLAVYGALKNLDRVKQGTVLIHYLNPAGGAAQGRDARTNWPVKWNSWQMISDERTAS